MTKDYINIFVLGPINSGKSTLINTFFSDYVAQTSLNKNILQPQIYIECDNTENITSNINIYNNTDIITNEPIDNIEPITYNVGTLNNLFGQDRKFKIKLFDFPGINDANIKDKYHDYLINNSYQADIVIMVIDANNMFNSNDEHDIFEFIIKNIIHKNLCDYSIITKLIILINKCDKIDKKEKKSIIEKISSQIHIKYKKIIKTFFQSIYEDDPIPMWQQFEQDFEKKNLFTDDGHNILHISLKNTFITSQILSDVSKLKLSELNYCGKKIFGNICWDNKTFEEKKDSLHNYIINNKLDFLKYLPNNNRSKLLNTLNSIINEKIIYYNKIYCATIYFNTQNKIQNTYENILLQILDYKDNKEISEEIIIKNINNIDIHDYFNNLFDFLNNNNYIEKLSIMPSNTYFMAYNVVRQHPFNIVHDCIYRKIWPLITKCMTIDKKFIPFFLLFCQKIPSADSTEFPNLEWYDIESITGGYSGENGGIYLKYANYLLDVLSYKNCNFFSVIKYLKYFINGKNKSQKISNQKMLDTFFESYYVHKTSFDDLRCENNFDRISIIK